MGSTFVVVVEGPEPVAVPARFELAANAVSCAQGLLERGLVEDAVVIATSADLAPTAGMEPRDGERAVWRA